MLGKVEKDTHSMSERKRAESLVVPINSPKKERGRILALLLHL
jgi:hypothetical protein